MVPCCICHLKYCYAVISLQLEFGTIIICHVIGDTASLKHKCRDVVGSEKMCGPIIEVTSMAVKRENLLIELSSSTGST